MHAHRSGCDGTLGWWSLHGWMHPLELCWLQATLEELNPPCNVSERSLKYLSWLCMYRWDLTADSELQVFKMPGFFLPRHNLNWHLFHLDFLSFSVTSSLLSLDDSRGHTSRTALNLQGRHHLCTRQFMAGCPKALWWLLITLYVLIYLADYVQMLYLSQIFSFLCGAIWMHFPASSPPSSLSYR